MRQNQLRGKILAFLAHIYPEKADEQTIISIYYQYHRYDDIKQALEYLTDKCYIQRTEHPHPYKEGEFVRLYKIMPDGIDIQQGMKTDPGVTRMEW